MALSEIGGIRGRKRRTLYFIITTSILASVIQTSRAYEDSYLSEVKNSCFKRGDVLSCIKYKALRLMSSTVFSPGYANETAIYGTNGAVSIVRMDNDLLEESAHYNEVNNFAMLEDGDIKRGYQSEWMKLARYAFLQAKSYLSGKGLKIELPEGSRSYEVEEESVAVPEDGRGKKKKLAILLPLLSLLAILKVKLLLLPILLAVIFIKKLLIIAALLLPSLFSTLKMCKFGLAHDEHSKPLLTPSDLDVGNVYSNFLKSSAHGSVDILNTILDPVWQKYNYFSEMPQMNHGHWTSADSTPDFSSAGYGAGYSYGGGASSGNAAGYGKDWAASRAYNAQRPRHGQAGYILSGGNGVFAESKTK